MKHKVAQMRELVAEIERLLGALKEKLDEIDEPEYRPSSHAAALQQQSIDARKRLTHDPHLGRL